MQILLIKMTKSKSNDNGRYFEYLITKELKKDLDIKLTDRAKIDQERDKKKNSSVSEKNIKIMNLAAKKISSWVSTKFSIEKNMILDRLPDISEDKNDFSHSDISIGDLNKKIGLSIKFNHEAFWHARMYSFYAHMGFEENDEEALNFKKDAWNYTNICKHSIPPFTVFSKNRKILPQYIDAWKIFAENMSLNISNFINSQSSNAEKVQILFKSIIGNDMNNYRIINKRNTLIFQDLSKLKLPKFVESKVIQKIEKHVFYILIEFDNGVIVEARTKQDSSKMVSENAQIKIKPDWKVLDWGKSGIKEETFKLN